MRYSILSSVTVIPTFKKSDHPPIKHVIRKVTPSQNLSSGVSLVSPKSAVVVTITPPSSSSISIKSQTQSKQQSSTTSTANTSPLSPSYPPPPPAYQPPSPPAKSTHPPPTLTTTNPTQPSPPPTNTTPAQSPSSSITTAQPPPPLPPTTTATATTQTKSYSNPPPSNKHSYSHSHSFHPSRSLTDLARRLATQGPLKTHPTPRRIRFLFNGAMVADTLNTSGALYVWEHDMYPQFYLPMEAFVQPSNFDVHLTPGDSITSSPNSDMIIGGGLQLSVKRAASPPSEYKHLTEMILFAADLSGPAAVLSNMVKVTFDAVGQWFEEDTPIYIHPKDPFKRIDVLFSTRPIRVLVNDVVVAESSTSFHLYETLLPTRYYLPLTSLDTSVLRPSTTRMMCPYKGESMFHSVSVKGEVLKDLVWYYPRPNPECAAIAGLCAFYGERVDVEFGDGRVSNSGSSGSVRWRREKRPESHMA